MVMEDDDSYQQEDGAEDGVQKKLHGGLGGAFAAVPGDEEVHGDEDDFETEEEEEEIEGDEVPRTADSRRRNQA